MSGDGSIAPSVRVDWGTPQASTSTTTSAAPDTKAMSRLDRVIEEYLASDDPVPTNTAHEIGDGDFRAIGVEFLRYFVELGGLTPEDDVLDIGCGFGRMALPLARYLAPEGRYVGFDIVREPVDWCREQVAPLFPSLEFAHLDVHHPLYNPTGSLPDDAGFFGRIPPLLSRRPNFITAVSVLTHLERPAMLRALADARRMLLPGGTLFLTAFLIDGRPTSGDACAFPETGWQRHGPMTWLRGAPATAAIGIDRAWLDEVLANIGWRATSVAHGHWRGGDSVQRPFQDVVIAR